MFDHEPARVLPPLRPRLLLWALVMALLIGTPLAWGLGWVLSRLGLIEGPPPPIEVWYDPLQDGNPVP